MDQIQVSLVEILDSKCFCGLGRQEPRGGKREEEKLFGREGTGFYRGKLGAVHLGAELGAVHLGAELGASHLGAELADTSAST